MISFSPVLDHCHDHGRHIRHDHVTPQDCVDFYTRVLKLGCRCIERESPWQSVGLSSVL